MKSFMKELKPQSLEDVIAGNFALPSGPHGFHSAVHPRKNRPDTIRYDCPQMEPILKPTYGCIVYQEQVMQIVRELAGYTLGRSDLVRRAMSKKKLLLWQKNARISFTEMPKREYRDVSPTVFPRRSQTRSTMR